MTLTVAERVDMWVRCGLLVKAGDEAFKAKDRGLLEDLRTKASGSASVEIERLVGMLPQGKR
jgi:hypothetical protein